MAKNTNSTSYEFYKQKNKEEMKYQLITFALMIIFTLVSFGMVIAEYNPMFTIPVIILLACVQVGFQLYYFMHMSHKGHGLPALFLYSGVFVALLTVLAMVTIVWW
ncbi:cytochrome c oxidase subunit IVB [Pontibacillus salipaludis]|uniref:Cytochrome c oxidase subunit 4B n=1 Tax=Pontibacillus salipaludis TaxID=1697394 RepID=A0ABQ1Q8R7_9BACI|nr:cytochrome c oxidase subunit IVB [Pontibacillus salipaludis]GGD19355.1 cytochrome c oxidase subunit 4B [Pontibacillus salipaludis]